MNPMIGLRFLLMGGAYLQVVVTSAEAEEIQAKWSSGWYQVKDQKTISHTDPNLCGTWYIAVDKIQAIHEVPPPSLPARSLLDGREGQFPTLDIPQAPATSGAGTWVPANWRK